MNLLSIYLFGIFAFVSSDAISASTDAQKIPNAIKMRNWNEIFQKKDLTRNAPTNWKAPEFMMELYDAFVHSNGTLKHKKVLEGNTVRSFKGQSSGSYHFFNLTSFGQDERVTKVEFRRFRRKQPFMGRHHFYKVDLYEALDSRSKPCRGNLTSSSLLPVYTKGWEVFNLTQMMTEWILHSCTNNGNLVVTALTSDNWFESRTKESLSDETNAYLVIYSDDGRKHYQHPPFHTDAQKIPNAIKMRNWNEIFQIKDLTRNAPTNWKAPEFMMELYDAFVHSNGTLKHKKVLEGNTVRSFKGQSSGSYHFFNLTSFGQDERVTKVEFRRFRRKQPFMGRPHFYKVDLYEALDSRSKPCRGNLTSSSLLPVYTKGWEVFNLTQMVTEWILHSCTNNGNLVVTALPSDNWFESRTKESQSDETNAYLVIYSNDGRKHYQHPPFHTGQNTSTSLKFLEPTGHLGKSMRNRRSVRALTSTCQRTSLYVDFTKIGWSGWIISPKGYNAYSCMGSCPFPLGGGLRPTNHATVISIMNMLEQSHNVGKPSCVPDVLHPITLLYINDEENVVVKQFPDMVAASCGCR